MSNFPVSEIVFDNGEGTCVVRGSDGLFYGVGADGIEMTTPAQSVDEALDDLAVARIIEDGKATGMEPFEIGVSDGSSSDIALEGLIKELGFDPEGFRLEE